MSERREDPALSSARREALLVFAIWILACAWVLSVCYRYGYHRDADTLTYVLGFPDWVFWGVILPWSVCTALCFLLASCVIRDEDLGEEHAEEQLAPGDGLMNEGEHA